MEEKQLFGALTVYRELGAYLRRLEQFEKSKAAYAEAHRNAPEDVRTLIGRSQVASDAVHPDQAYANAQLALALEPKNMNARNMQARALHTMSEFEKAAVVNFRGYRERRQPHYFMEGINQALETIQDCIGENVSNVMIDFLPIIRKIEKRCINDFDEPKKVLHVCRIPQPRRKRKLTQMEARKQLILARVLAMKYLGPMAYDKFFLQALVKDHRLKSANVIGSLQLKEIASEALRSLSERQDMLRSQRPYYNIKLAEKAESGHHNKYKEEVLIRERVIGARTAETLLKQIDKSVRSNHVKELIAKAEQMQMFLDNKTPRTLPDKDVYIERLYRAVGEGYLSMHRLSYTLSERGNRRRVAFLMGLPVGRPKSFDSVMANYPYKFVDNERATAKVKANLDICENATMKCWLMYELSRLLCTQKNYALSRYYAKKCQDEAHDIENITWWMNGCFALLSGHMQQGNSNEVKQIVEEAYEYSKKMNNAETVQAFLAKCNEMVSETKSAYEEKAILQREKQILKIMDESQRIQTQVLFKSMSTVPPGRRFAVLPIKRHIMTDECERKRRRQKGLTVIPGPEKTLPKMPKSDTGGFQIFDI